MSDGGVSDLVEVRLLVPRGALVQAAPAPEFVSQANVLSLFGVPARRFLEMVRAPSFPGRVICNGRLRLVRRADFMAALEQLDDLRSERSAPVANDNDSGRQPARPSVAERLGLEEVPPPRRRRAG